MILNPPPHGRPRVFWGSPVWGSPKSTARV
nr:MAG TPA: hypothetical protein [Microviridae sp.]